MKELFKTFSGKILAPATEAGSLSIGRVMLIITFVVAIIKWTKGIEIPDTQLTVLITLIGYVLGTKVLSGVKEMMTNVKDAKKAVKSEE